MALEDIRNEKLKKREAFLAAGIDPYPAITDRSILIGDALKKFETLVSGAKQITIAGRVMARREHGGSTFIDIVDGTGKLQTFFKEDVLGDEYKRLMELVDIGDVIEATGKAFETKRGEPTVEVRNWKMLSKSLRPLPEKWHGLQDVEERFRKRYLDLLMNDDVRARFVTRSRIISAIRAFFDKEGFLEVETPMLQTIPGGALAKPFATHHNALDIDLYLRIAPELYLKELLVGGFEKVYEVGKNFRNEGIDPTHNPEFTSVEWYAAYWDEEKMMDCVERCFGYVLKQLKMKGGFTFEGGEIQFPTRISRIDFKQLLKQYALIVDYDAETRESLALRARQLGIEVGAHEPKGKIADEIYKKICRPYLVQPTFLVNHPLDISPLAKKRGPDVREARRFQLIVAGTEVVNGYSELNDPLEQRARFEEQQNTREAGEDEAHRIDNDFVEALEYAMPPAAGAAIGIDRLIMLLTDTRNIKEVILFPTMKPK